MRSNANSDIPFRTAYGPSRRVGKVCEGVSLTKQSFKDECDINLKVKRFQRAGMLPPAPEPRYADVSGLDFQAAQFAVTSVVSFFKSLPAELRKRFDNDPSKMAAFAADPANAAEAAELGLVAKPEEVPSPVRVEVVAPPAAPEPPKAPPPA